MLVHSYASAYAMKDDDEKSGLMRTIADTVKSHDSWRCVTLFCGRCDDDQSRPLTRPPSLCHLAKTHHRHRHQSDTRNVSIPQLTMFNTSEAGSRGGGDVFNLISTEISGSGDLILFVRQATRKEKKSITIISLSTCLLTTEAIWIIRPW